MDGDLPRRIPEGARPRDSGCLTDPGTIFEVTLEAEGVYDYFCRPHEAAGMVGRIVVASGAARRAFPSVEEILRRGEIRPNEDNR